jgi:hypothetical protein
MPKAKQTKLDDVLSESDTDSEVEAKDLTWEDVRIETLRFGKYKGKSMYSMIKTTQRRDYLKYLLRWQDLREITRNNITFALEVYDQRYKHRRNM